MSDIVNFNPIRALDRDGLPVPGALAYFFLSGTTTPQVVYTTQALDVAHPIPLEADSRGVFPPVFSPLALRCTVTDSSGTTLPGFPIDPVATTPTGSGASQVTFAPSPAVPATNVQAAIDFLANGLTGKTIGEPFPLWDHLTGVLPPDNSGAAKFIRLTAGQSGLGQYNNGLLINEAVSGSSPVIVATAEIATGALAGQTVRLLNTEGRFLRPGETSGALQDSALGSHTHTGTTSTTGAHTHGTNVRVGNTGGGGSLQVANDSNTEIDGFRVTTNSAGDHSHTFTTAATGGNETRPRNIAATYYMRIL